MARKESVVSQDEEYGFYAKDSGGHCEVLSKEQ